MDLRDCLHAVRKRWWLVVGVTLAALAVAGAVTVRTTPQYASSVTFFVTTLDSGASNAYQGGLFSQQRVKSYASLLASDRLAQAIAADASVGLSADEVRQRIVARPVPETVLLEATVVDSSRSRSKLIADVLAEQFKKLVETLETPSGVQRPSVKVEVVTGPRLDPVPASPRPLRNLGLGALLGLAFGIGAALLRELLDNTVRSADALGQLTGGPVLAGVPFDAGVRKAPLVVGAGARTPRAEALRQLRTNLQFVDVDRPVRSLVVTSAVPGEGKSSTACNLAIVFAEAGKRVLLVDADLRRPRLAAYLGLEGGVGLTDVLARQVPADAVTQMWGPRLWLLPSGFLPPNPSELLGSQQMADLLATFRTDFDMVIIDSPPLLPVTDGAVAAGRADGALLVTRAGKTSTSQVTAAVRALRAVDARLLGSVFNMVSVAGSDPYHYYEYTDESGRHRAGTEPSTGPAAPAPDQHEPAPPSAPGRLGAPDDELPAGPEPATKVSAAR